MTKLEEKLVSDLSQGKQIGEDIDLEEALLIAGGVQDSQTLKGYQEKLDALQTQILPRGNDSMDVEGDSYSRLGVARGIFHALWRTKPNRYNNHFLLPQVLDAQLSEDGAQQVGNCLGLTSLYTVLAKRTGLSTGVFLKENHIGSVVRSAGIQAFVENTSPDGFGLDMQDVKKIFSANELVSITYSSKAHSEENQRNHNTDLALLSSCDSSGLRDRLKYHDEETADYSAMLPLIDREINLRAKGAGFGRHDESLFFTRAMVRAHLYRLSKHKGERKMLKEKVADDVESMNQIILKLLSEVKDFLYITERLLEEGNTFENYSMIPNGRSYETRRILDVMKEPKSSTYGKTHRYSIQYCSFDIHWSQEESRWEIYSSSGEKMRGWRGRMKDE